MAKIQSSIDEASNCASTISSAGADVMSVAQATKDETTTLSGNATAHSKIDLDDITAKQIANSINSFVGLIHGTANAFASTDSRLGQMIFFNITHHELSQLAFENLSYKDSSDLDEIHLDFRRLNDSVTADIEDFKRNLQRKENALIDRRDKLFYQRQNLLQELEKERREK